jgi:hypothetical protein
MVQQRGLNRANACQSKLCSVKSILEACVTEVSLAIGRAAPSVVSLADGPHGHGCTVRLGGSEICKANHGVGVNSAGTLSRADLPG